MSLQREMYEAQLKRIKKYPDSPCKQKLIEDCEEMIEKSKDEE